MAGRVDWGYDASRAGGSISFVLTETGGGGATGIVILSGQYTHEADLSAVMTYDPETGEEVNEDLDYDILATALKTALDAVGNATYTVTFTSATQCYTISATGGSVTAFALSSLSTGATRMLGAVASSGALSYVFTTPVWHFTQGSIGGFSEWNEAESDLDGQDLIAADGSVRGLSPVGAPRTLDFVVPWEPMAAVWNQDSASAAAWTWQKAFARCRNVEPIAVEDPRDAGQWVVGYMRSDSTALRPRLASADYLAHQSIPMGLFIIGKTEAAPSTALLAEDGSPLLTEADDYILTET